MATSTSVVLITFLPCNSGSEPRINMLAKVTGAGTVGSHAPVPLEITADRERNKAVVTHYGTYASTVSFSWPVGYLRSGRHGTGSKKTNLLHNMIRLLAAKCANSRRFLVLSALVAATAGWMERV